MPIRVSIGPWSLFPPLIFLLSVDCSFFLCPSRKREPQIFTPTAKMYGAAGKLGRGGGGGGRGGVRRSMQPSSFQPPPPPTHRSTAPSGRPTFGAGSSAPRNRASGASSSAKPTFEETFSLVAENPLGFAAIIRLAPDLVEEIKRAEAQGESARIKFDSNSTNPALNVIQVGGKEFRFTWSPESPVLCDIYEERQSGEDGNGLLVESGCALRKVNMQRILDESTKNHVKMRSAEAEQKQKSRRAIVLEHGNPSLKNQIKAIAAVDANPWNSKFKQKKEPPFKKRKFERPQVVAPPKSVHKAGSAPISAVKGTRSASPLSSPPEYTGFLESPSGAGNLTKGHTVTDVMPMHSKENAANFEKDIPSKASSSVLPGKLGCKGHFGTVPRDLQSMLITLLMDNPKGMSLKALEKAVGDTIPYSTKKIDTIIKKIANFQAPGRYILKPGVVVESFKKPSSQNRRSPEENHHETPPIEENHDRGPAPDASFTNKASTSELEEPKLLNFDTGEETKAMEKIDTQGHSPKIFSDKRASENIEGQGGSSSGSGSDSDSESDSSESGSDRSDSGTSSDSDTDVSSNSKEASDEEVDIMSDDDKEGKHKLQTFEPVFPSLPIPLGTPKGVLSRNGIDEKHDDHPSDHVVEIEKDLLDEQETETAVISELNYTNEEEKPPEGTKSFSPEHGEHREPEVHKGNFYDEREGTNRESSRHAQSESTGRSQKGKAKRIPDVKQFDERSERAKKLKSGSMVEPLISGATEVQLLDGSHDLVDANSENLISNSQQAVRKSLDHVLRTKATETSIKHGVGMAHGAKYSERTFHGHGGFPLQKNKSHRETQGGDGCNNGRTVSRNLRDDSVRDKHTLSSESAFQKHELFEMPMEAGQVPNSLIGSSPRNNYRTDADRSAAMNETGSILQRELSDLELGELRETFPEETSGAKKQFERKSSFKQAVNWPSTSDHWNMDFSKANPIGKSSLDLRDTSPPNSGIRTPSKLEASNKNKTPEYHVEDSTISHHKAVQGQSQHLSRVDNAETGLQFSKLADGGGRSRQYESVMSQEIGLEEYGGHKKSSGMVEQGLAQRSSKDYKTGKTNSAADVNDRRKVSMSADIHNDVQQGWVSSTNEISCPYAKYEKEDPDLKGAIKDFPQYEEYVQEYRGKYDSYLSLNNVLENYRNEFRKLGDDLGVAKARDMETYYKILSQLNESYRQHGARHRQLKKIFIVLHQELKNLKQKIKDFAAEYMKDSSLCN